MTAKLPVAQPAGTWPSQFTIRRCANALDKLVEHYGQMGDVLKKLQDRPVAADDVDRANKVARRYEQHIARQKIAEHQELLNECEPDTWSDENGSANKSEVAKMLAILMGSFPTSNLPDAGVFVNMLLEDVMATGSVVAGPAFYILESACRELRITKTFMPAIAEVIAAIKDQEAAWDRRLNALDRIEETYDELVAATDAAEKKIEARRRSKAIENKPSSPMEPVVSVSAADPMPARGREWWKD